MAITPRPLNTMTPPSPASPDESVHPSLSDEQLAELLRPGKEFENNLHATLKQLSAGSINLLVVPLKDYSSTAHALLTYYHAQKTSGVYVSINKPTQDILKGINVQLTQTQFVDAITALTGKGTEDTQQITFIDSPLALVELNLAISDRMKGLVSNQKFLVVDSISTLLVYNTPQSVEKFCHTIIAKNRGDNVIGLLLMINSDEHHDVVETLAQFVDHVIIVK
ncbi:MAG: hypothetical protein FJY86_00835 [Candidatus Diapherotrites archaeon]|uniref:KaiC-like domain-containing protein n=1 Tax=Candidatus Iainarchaeum sp. TaxID=3101447 RepID=A0A8T4C634_9ARCH|nr:hypothetical protein [Candidatus Diapherotrites archaeon]